MFMAIISWPMRGALSLLLVAGSSGRAGFYMMLGLMVLLVPFWYLAISNTRRARRRWIRRGEVFDEGLGTVRQGQLVGHFRGREVALFDTGGGRYHPMHSMNARVACASPLGFEVYPRATVEVGKPQNSFDVGVPDLDHDFGFVSNTPDRFKAWFEKPENRQLLVAMLRRGSHRSRLELKTGLLTWGISEEAQIELDLLSTQTASSQSRFIQTDETKRGDLERDQAREILEALSQLAAALERGF